MPPSSQLAPRRHRVVTSSFSILATVQAAERTPPPCGHLHRAGPQIYLSWGLTRQGWRGGWDLTRWARSSCDEPFFCLLSISPTKPGESGQQRRQPAANASRRPLLNPATRSLEKSHRAEECCGQSTWNEAHLASIAHKAQLWRFQENCKPVEGGCRNTLNK